MCGIAGWLGSPRIDEGIAVRMAKALRHRGPDSHGMKSWPEATLVHTRLKIIDLSPSGEQPMPNEDGTIWAIFNGEIYNHHELRRCLVSHGHVFKGHSDTEVLPHLYEEMGSGFVKELRGMFAFAIYDTRERKLLVGRDRFGIKPVFYAAGTQRIAFASEIKAILELPDVSDEPDRQAIYDFAALFFIPAPETFYAGIRALQPGEILEARFDGRDIVWDIHTYHKWTIAPDHTMTLNQAVDRAEALMSNAVRKQLESEVPLGALLSGGIDSSLVSASAQSAIRGGLRTFNVRFSERQYDETWAAMSVAEHIGSHHETLDMNGARGSWNDVVGLLLHAGQPFADTSLFACNSVCRLMRQHVTVALSGDGGDEGFGGYNSFSQIGWIALGQMLPAIMWRGASMALTPLANLGALPTSLPHRLRELPEADDVAIVQNLSCWVREQEHHSLCRDMDLLPIRRLFEPQWDHRPPPGASRLERLSMLATETGVRLSLPNDFLFKVDTASMKESMEIRVPMLDEDLFDFTLSLPHSLKVNGRTCKRVLRAIANRRLPPLVANKPKQGFEIPVDAWVGSDFRGALREELLGPSSRLSEFFQPESYRPMIEAFCDRSSCSSISRTGLYQRVIMLLSVQATLNRSAI